MKLFEKKYEDCMQSYFYLRKRIKIANEALEDMRYRFENKNRYTRTAFDEHTGDIYKRAYNFENDVADLVDGEKKARERIDRMEQRARLFEKYFFSLEEHEQKYLKDRYYTPNTKVKVNKAIEKKAIYIVRKVEDLKIDLAPQEYYKFKKIKKDIRENKAREKEPKSDENMALNDFEVRPLVEII